MKRMATDRSSFGAFLPARRDRLTPAQAGITALARSLMPGTSFADYLFREPLARERIVNWAEFGARSVAAFRMELGRHPEDHRLAADMEKLRRADPEVARWWDDHTVRDYASVR